MSCGRPVTEPMNKVSHDVSYGIIFGDMNMYIYIYIFINTR